MYIQIHIVNQVAFEMADISAKEVYELIDKVRLELTSIVTTGFSSIEQKVDINAKETREYIDNRYNSLERRVDELEAHKRSQEAFDNNKSKWQAIIWPVVFTFLTTCLLGVIGYVAKVFLDKL